MPPIASNCRTLRSVAPLGRLAPFAPLAAVLLLIGGFPSIVAGAPAKKPSRVEAPLPLPDGLKIPVYAPGPMPFYQHQQLVYRVSWIGIPAAEAKIRLNGNGKDPALWSGEAWIQTNRAVDLLFKMRDYMREDFQHASFIPRAIYISQRENQRENEYLLSFDRSKALVTTIKRNKRGSDTRRFAADNPWGPISGAIMALSQPLKVGQKLIFDVFSARNRYVISFEVARRQRLSTALGDMDALRIVPRLVYLSDEDGRKKARETTVWVSADRRHIPLRIEAAAFIGKLRIDLVEMSDTSRPAASGEARDISSAAEQ